MTLVIEEDALAIDEPGALAAFNEAWADGWAGRPPRIKTGVYGRTYAKASTARKDNDLYEAKRLETEQKGS